MKKIPVNTPEGYTVDHTVVEFEFNPEKFEYKPLYGWYYESLNPLKNPLDDVLKKERTDILKRVMCIYIELLDSGSTIPKSLVDKIDELEQYIKDIT